MRRVLPVLLVAILLAGLLLWLRSAGTPPAAPPPPMARERAPVAAVVPAEARTAPAPAPGPLPGEAPAPTAASEEGNYRIHGRVAFGGAGVAGAKVQVRAWTGTEKDPEWTIRDALTAADGTFSVRMDRSRASMGFGVETSAEGYVEGWLLLKPGEYDEGRGVEVPVEPARAIVGRVVDEYARPVPGTVVQLWYGSETTWPTTVDAEGRFRTPARAPRRAFELVVEAPGYPRRTVPIPEAPAEESMDVGDLVFRRGGRVAGIAVDAAGRAVAGVPLCLTGIAGDSDPSTLTDEGGRFEFTDVGEGTVGVTVDAPGRAKDASGNLRSYTGGTEGVAVGRTDLRIVLSAETTVTLRFVDATTGDPILVSKTEFLAWIAGTPAPDRPARGSSSTTPFGEERMSFRSGARYDVLLRSPGFEEARISGLDVPDVAEMTVDLPLRRSR